MPPEIEVYDPESACLLATGRAAECAETEVHPFRCVKGNSVLLSYYFAKGKRQVMVRLGPNEGITAHLGTRWVGGHRQWTLDW